MSDELPLPDPAAHLNALRAALPLVALAERGDPDAFTEALAAVVAGPEDAGLVVHGLVELVRFALGRPALPPGPDRLAVLDGMLVDLAGYQPGD